MLRLVRTGEAEPAEASNAADSLAFLADGACRGDVAAARTLLAAVGPWILRAVRGVIGAHHSEVEDVSQDAALAFLEALPSFRGGCSVRHFASRIAVHQAITARRKLRVRARWTSDSAHASEESPSMASEASSPARLAANARCRQALRELLDAIPETQAEALMLHCVLGHSVDEIAGMMSAPLNTVRSRLRLGKEALRSRIEGDDALLGVMEGGE